jgi:hypothetical protein
VKKLLDVNTDIQAQKKFLLDKASERNMMFTDVSKKIIGFGLLSLGILQLVAYCNIH